MKLVKGEDCNLHSILVRFKAIDSGVPIKQIEEFTFHSGKIQGEKPLKCSCHKGLFTFHSGKIQGYTKDGKKIVSDKFTFHSGKIQGKKPAAAWPD